MKCIEVFSVNLSPGVVVVVVVRCGCGGVMLWWWWCCLTVGVVLSYVGVPLHVLVSFGGLLMGMCRGEEGGRGSEGEGRGFGREEGDVCRGREGGRMWMEVRKEGREGAVEGSLNQNGLNNIN